MTDHTKDDIRRAVRSRYARAATGGGAVETQPDDSAEASSCCGPTCCGPDQESASLAIGYESDALQAIPEEADLGLGCGNPTAIASLQPGQTVLDLGSGGGIDCFLASREVGPRGHVIGVDMTPEMVDRARANAAKGGYENVEFRLGEIEALPVADRTVDVIISNCVLNLSPEKDRVLAEAYRVLKPGGRMVVSDLVSHVPVPAAVGNSLDAVAGCLPTSREAYLSEFVRAGFQDVRITSEKRYPVDYLLADPHVVQYLEEHPEHRVEIEEFAGSIFGAHFEASRPSEDQ